VCAFHGLNAATPPSAPFHAFKVRSDRRRDWQLDQEAINIHIDAGIGVSIALLTVLDAP
jgi:hypothetical protein